MICEKTIEDNRARLLKGYIADLESTMEIKELFKIAYKKLKSSLYYDKTQSILRDEIVVFESEHANIEEYLESIAEDFVNVETREKMIENILSKISYNAFPKKLESDNSEMLKNYSKAELMIEETQYYIHLHVLGHILGVLWLLTIGYKVDKNIYRYSYGNRIRSSLYNELSEKPTYSPYLFEPYFQQYESWRDMAMDEAMHHLHLGQDVVVLTLDFRRFYYSIDITEELMQDILDEVIQEGESNEILKALNDLVFRIIQKYSSLFQEWKGRHILPIGFLPSNVLANYALKNFDQAVLDGWNPLYYGRYVDDIIIVEKVEDQSDIFKRAQKDELKAKDVIDYFLEQCSGWKGLKGIKCELGKQYALLSYDEKENCYILNKQYNPKSTDNSEIIVQDRKVKIFYFRSGESDALITCFRENIAKNKSEFRHMPEDEAVFRKDDYNEIYDLQNEETINKFRGIKSISVDKYELSKLLGKHLRIGGLITDVKETGFEKQISKIFNSRVIIENYIVWEKVIEILVINESYAFLQDYIYSIVNAIECLDHNNKLVLKNIKESMQHYLYAILCRALALVWGPDLNSFINKLFAKLIKQDSGMQQVGIRLTKMKRESYFKSRMIDKSVMPIFIDMLDFEKVIDTTQNLNLTNFAQEMLLCKNEWDSHYYFYPYLITMYDFSMIACITELNKDDRIIELDGDDHSIFDPVSMYKQQIRNYIKNNYKTEDQKSDLCPIMVKTQESIKKIYFRI